MKSVLYKGTVWCTKEAIIFAKAVTENLHRLKLACEDHKGISENGIWDNYTWLEKKCPDKQKNLQCLASLPPWS